MTAAQITAQTTDELRKIASIIALMHAAVYQTKDPRFAHDAAVIAVRYARQLLAVRDETEIAWQAELVRCFGKNAGDLRYMPAGQGMPGTRLRELHDAFMIARYGYVPGYVKFEVSR